MRETGQIQAVERLSDDDDSTLQSSLEPPPAYDTQPQEIDIDQEGFQANARAACESARLSTPDKSIAEQLRPGQMMVEWISKSVSVLADSQGFSPLL